MYPTISYLIEDLFGVFIPLHIQTFGFFVAIAFLGASWMLALELKRKEKEGLIKPFIQERIIGLAATPWQLISAALVGFLIGYKLLDAALHYSDFVANPQGFILSTDGHLIGGILGAFFYTYNKYREFQKQVLPEPKTIQETIHPYEMVGNFTMLAAAAGLLCAKIFHNL